IHEHFFKSFDFKGMLFKMEGLVESIEKYRKLDKAFNNKIEEEEDFFKNIFSNKKYLKFFEKFITESAELDFNLFFFNFDSHRKQMFDTFKTSLEQKFEETEENRLI